MSSLYKEKRTFLFTMSSFSIVITTIYNQQYISLQIVMITYESFVPCYLVFCSCRISYFKAYRSVHWNSISFQGLSIVVVMQVFLFKVPLINETMKKIKIVQLVCVNTHKTRHSLLFLKGFPTRVTYFLISLVLSVSSMVLTF